MEFTYGAKQAMSDLCAKPKYWIRGHDGKLVRGISEDLEHRDSLTISLKKAIKPAKSKKCVYGYHAHMLSSLPKDVSQAVAYSYENGSRVTMTVGDPWDIDGKVVWYESNGRGGVTNIIIETGGGLRVYASLVATKERCIL